jgi:predicted transposase YdaD
MMVTTYEKGIAKGREEGRQVGRQEAARLLLERKFGPLSATVLARLAAWPAERLDELLLAVLDAPSLSALGLEEGHGKTE